MEFRFKRTTANDNDFRVLVKKLDHELWEELKEDQATYDQHNKVENITTAIIAYANNEPVACGCFKKFDGNTAEIKRMFVRKDHRGNGLSKKILFELEQWAREKDYQYAVLETSVHFKVARNLYSSNGYITTPNYGPYLNLKESVCMRKDLRKNS